MEYWDIVDACGRKTGKLHLRGTPMQKGEYHLSVSVWILNSRQQFLISKRTHDKPNAPDMWETTGGSAIAGETSLQAALRETREELGLSLNPSDGEVFLKYTFPHSSGDGACYIEVWVFRCEAELSDVILQVEETCEACWVEKEMIQQLIAEGKFINYTYIKDLFEKYANSNSEDFRV